MGFRLGETTIGLKVSGFGVATELLRALWGMQQTACGQVDLGDEAAAMAFQIRPDGAVDVEISVQSYRWLWTLTASEVVLALSSVLANVSASMSRAGLELGQCVRWLPPIFA